MDWTTEMVEWIIVVFIIIMLLPPYSVYAYLLTLHS